MFQRTADGVDHLGLHFCHIDSVLDLFCSEKLGDMTLEQRRHALVTLLTRWQAFKENRRDRSPGMGVMILACTCSRTIQTVTGE